MSPLDLWQSPMPSDDDENPFSNQNNPSGVGNMAEPTREEIDAKIAAAEARTDTKFAQLFGEVRHIQQSVSGTKTTIIITGIAVLGVLVAILGYGQQWLGLGLNISDVAQKSATSAIEQYAREHPTPPVKN